MMAAAQLAAIMGWFSRRHGAASAPGSIVATGDGHTRLDLRRLGTRRGLWSRKNNGAAGGIETNPIHLGQAAKLPHRTSLFRLSPETLQELICKR